MSERKVYEILRELDEEDAGAIQAKLVGLSDRLATAEKERDEATAVMREVLNTYGDYEEFDPLRRYLGLPLYDSTESWQARGAALATPSEENPDE